MKALLLPFGSAGNQVQCFLHSRRPGKCLPLGSTANSRTVTSTAQHHLEAAFRATMLQCTRKHRIQLCSCGASALPLKKQLQKMYTDSHFQVHKSKTSGNAGYLLEQRQASWSGNHSSSYSLSVSIVSRRHNPLRAVLN